MKAHVVTAADGRILCVMRSDDDLGAVNEGALCRPRAMPGQYVHLIDVPGHLKAMRSSHLIKQLKCVGNGQSPTF